MENAKKPVFPAHNSCDMHSVQIGFAYINLIYYNVFDFIFNQISKV